jgi:hypothetical protein
LQSLHKPVTGIAYYIGVEAVKLFKVLLLPYSNDFQPVCRRSFGGGRKEARGKKEVYENRRNPLLILSLKITQ